MSKTAVLLWLIGGYLALSELHSMADGTAAIAAIIAVVDVIVEIGECGAQPQRGRVEPVRARSPRRRRQDPVLAVGARG